MTVATATLQRARQLHALEVMGEVLLGWGALSALLYVAGDVLAATRYEGYAFAARRIGELSAVGAPTRMLAVALALAYGVLVVGFGVAVWECARGKRALRATGGLLIASGLLAFVAPFFPLHPRGAATSLTDAMHVAIGAAAVLLVLLQLAFGSAAAGRPFRLYSIATFLVVLVLAALAAGTSTPWVGALERVAAGAYLAWVAALDVVLLRAEIRAARAGQISAQAPP